MGPLTLHQLRKSNQARQNEWGGGENVDLTFRGLEHTGEVGELTDSVLALLIHLGTRSANLSNVLKKIARLDNEIDGTTETREQLLRYVEDEAGDALVTLDLIMMELGLDLAKATANKFNATSRKHGLKTRIV